MIALEKYKCKNCGHLQRISSFDKKCSVCVKQGFLDYANNAQPLNDKIIDMSQPSADNSLLNRK